jgi:hypothetical protein
MEYYEGLDYLNHTYLDEMVLLAGQLVDISTGNPEFPKAKEEYETAKSLIKRGKRTEAVAHATRAYNMLYFDSPKT